MDYEDWLADTRISYDTVAASYAEHVRGLLEESPYDQAVFELFARLVRESGGGPVVDMGCGPGRITAHLRQLGLDASGIDLSPAMVQLAQDEYPDLRFAVGSMTDLKLADRSRLKSEGYGGRPMRVYVHRRRPHQLAARLRGAGFDVEAELIMRSPESAGSGGVIFARAGRRRLGA